MEFININMWYKEYSLAEINAFNQKTMIDHIGIEFISIEKNTLKAMMPVDYRTVQPARLLHGGASAALAETMGSVASYLLIDPSQFQCVGLELNINHVRGVTSGNVTGTVTPLHIGKSTHLWEIRIESEEGKLVAVSRLTMMIIPIKS
jgi:1,4-dihydroxy-2-naphthoyl-CoA hydrolase